jgi:TPR repeat protein
MGATPAAALDARQRAPDLSGVPASLRDWLSAMLEPDPAQRPATLDALLEHWPGTSSSGSHAATVWRSKAMVLAVAVAFVVAAGGGLYRLWPRPRSDDIPALMRAGRLDDAFKYARRLLVSGQPPPVEDTWALARALRAAGQLNEGFALARELANGGFGPAAYMLAEMYDPLSRAPSPLPPNAAKAREWYGRAAESGVAQARDRLRALEAQAKGR